MVRTLARVGAIVALALPMAAVVAQPAAAATVFGRCATVKGSATFSPGITNTPRDNTVTAKGSETNCTPVAGTGGSGTLNAIINVKQASCAKLAQGAQTLTGKANTHWKNGKISAYNITIKTGTGSNATLATITGKVVSGQFTGKTLTGQIRFKVSGTPNCTTVPVKSVTFVNTKAFILWTP